MMLCEDQMMSVDTTKSPAKQGGGSLNSSTSSILSHESKPLMSTWAEEMLKSEYASHSDESRATASLNSSTSSTNGITQQAQNISVKKEIEIKQERDIALEFIDDVNEEKFERLIKEEKLKTPFKRRHSQTPSNDSRSNSPNSLSGSYSDVSENSKRHQFKGHKEEKRVRHNSYTSSSSSSSYTESDPAILSRRQKQIDYGKNTVAYERYTEMVPKPKRTRDHPRTPNKYGKYSRRAFDGLVKIWRKQLHCYDPPVKTESAENPDDSDSDSD